MHRRYDPAMNGLAAWRLALSVPLERRKQMALGRAALARYDLPGAQLVFLSASGNLVFRVVLGDRSYALRIGTPGRRTLQQVEAELAYGADLRRELGIRTPQALPGRDGRAVQVFHGPDGMIRPAVLFTWMPGAGFGDRPTPAQMEVLGRCQARMHAFACSGGHACAQDRPRLDEEEVAAWTVLPAAAARLLSAPDQGLVRAIAAHVRAQVPALFARSPQGLVHFDLQGGNLMLAGDDLGLIDLDDCLTAPVVLDMATSLTYTTTKPDADALRAAFLSGHASVNAAEVVPAALLDAAMALIALREMGRVLGWTRVTEKPWGPVVLEESLRVLHAMAARMGVQVAP